MRKIICLTATFLLFLTFNANSQISGVKKPEIKSVPDADVYDLNGVHTSLKQLAKNKVCLSITGLFPARNAL